MASIQSAQRRSRVAVFICSSDSRRDVLDSILPSILKFWPDCPYRIYVGLNSNERPLPIGTPVLAPASEWYLECAQQLSQLDEQHLILMLDDFLIGAPVDRHRLTHLIEDALALELAYLRLLPLGRSLPARLTGWRPPEIKPGIERIRAGRPFYSGLQIAVWNKQYLCSLLQKSQSIWEFEHQYVPGSIHGAIKDRPPISYRHLVERGRWLPDARSLLRRAGLPAELGRRPVWPKSRYARLFLDQIRWVTLGYSTC